MTRSIGIEREVETTVPTAHGSFRCIGYTSPTGVEHVALVRGDPSVVATPLVRLHSECLTGDVFGSRRCDCGPQLDEALRLIAADECGVVVYLRGHEGRGIGLVEKLRAYRLQDAGLDTVDANLELGFEVDLRRFDDGAAILTDLGITSVRLLSNNPAKQHGLEEGGISVVACLPILIAPNPHNEAYLHTKRTRLGHTIPIGTGRSLSPIDQSS